MFLSFRSLPGIASSRLFSGLRAIFTRLGTGGQPKTVTRLIINCTMGAQRVLSYEENSTKGTSCSQSEEAGE